MSTTTTPSRVEGETVATLRAPTLGWALKRTLLAILILSVSIAASAWLFYASIDPEEENAPAAVSPGQETPAFSTGQPPAASRRV